MNGKRIVKTKATFQTPMALLVLLSLLLNACGQAGTAAPPLTRSSPPPIAQYLPAATQGAPGSSAQEMGQAGPQDNYFQNYGVNPFIDTREDHLSTFALDVDTAAYTVARRYVNDGLLPPKDAVRVEEFVNYFDGGYASPADSAFAIWLDAAPSPFHADGSLLLRVGIQGYRTPEEDRKPANLTFVIDVSGSMDLENRLGLVKQSLNLLVDRLGPSDSVAIVVYGSQARTILDPTSGAERAEILDAIERLQPEGSTNAEAGLILGYQTAMRAFRPGMINRVILCSDGVANVGSTGPEEILESIRGYAEEGITLTSVGFGMGNFNDVLMERLANDGNGHYAYVDSLEEARKLFVDNLTSTLQVIALDAKVQVDFNPEVVERYRLIGYENRDIADEDFRNDSVDAGEVGAGHSATALYAVLLKEGARGQLAAVSLRWEDPDTRQVSEISQVIAVEEAASQFFSAAPHFQLAAVAAQYAEVLRESPWAETARLHDLDAHAERLTGLLPEDSEVREFYSLVHRAAGIQR